MESKRVRAVFRLLSLLLLVLIFSIINTYACYGASTFSPAAPAGGPTSRPLPMPTNTSKPSTFEPFGPVDGPPTPKPVIVGPDSNTTKPAIGKKVALGTAVIRSVTGIGITAKTYRSCMRLSTRVGSIFQLVAALGNLGAIVYEYETDKLGPGWVTAFNGAFEFLGSVLGMIVSPLNVLTGVNDPSVGIGLLRGDIARFASAFSDNDNALTVTRTMAAVSFVGATIASVASGVGTAEDNAGWQIAGNILGIVNQGFTYIAPSIPEGLLKGTWAASMKSGSSTLLKTVGGCLTRWCGGGGILAQEMREQAGEREPQNVVVVNVGTS